MRFPFKAILRRLNDRFDAYPEPDFYEPADFPWARSIENDWEAIRAEFLSVFEHDNFTYFGHHSVNRLDPKRQWSTVPLHCGAPLPEATQLFPVTMRALNRIPGIVDAGFGVLYPGGQLTYHEGPYNGIIRYHLGVIIPADGSCALEVRGNAQGWSDGKSLLFADGRRHTAWNRGSEVRVILNAALPRPLRAPQRQINRKVLDHLVESGKWGGNLKSAREYLRSLQ